MNFFEHQELARKKTARLVVLFCVAVVSIVLALYAVGAAVMPVVDGSGGVALWNPVAAAVAIGLVLVIVGGGTLYKLSELRAGGRVIAEHLGGRLLSHDTTDAGERRLLNVVEEMAIASGVPVPPVYLLDHERGINAFAAGYRPEDAVVGVTRGAVDTLSRDELQGVMAHEFSHILSGDMRLNLRLVGVLHGILLLGLTGMMILRGLMYSGGGRRSRGSKDGGGVVVILAIAAALAVIGYIGTFFGNWIKAAVSRQREFLADASAVQFTRNPDGIAGALRAIGGGKRGARLDSPAAGEASHMFFGSALKSGLTGLFSTHPPLEKRIRRIDPSWDGKFDRPERARPRWESAEPARGGARAGAGVPGIPGVPGGVASPVILAGAVLALDEAVGSAGDVSSAHVEAARRLIERIPAEVRDAAHDPFSSRAVILAMLQSRDPAVRGRQSESVRGADGALAREVDRLAGVVGGLAPELRLPVLEQAMQPLGSLSGEQAERFRGLVESFIRADEKVDLFEWILHRLVSRRLEAAVGRASPRRVRYYGLGPLGGACSVLLSAVAWVGAREEKDARAAFGSGAAALEGVSVEFVSGEGAGLKRLNEAVDTLAAASPKLRRLLLRACAAVVMHDRVVTPREAELFRAVAESLEIPVPPVLATGV